MLLEGVPAVILFTHFSLISLACLLLICTALHEVIRAPSARGVRYSLIAFLAASALFVAALFLDSSVYSLGARPFYIVEYPTILAEMLAFAELSRRVAGKRERRFFLPYIVTLSLLTLAWVVGFLKALNSGADYYSLDYSILLVLPIGLIVWSVFLLAMGLYRLTHVFPLRLFATWRTIAKGDDEAKAIYFFFLTALTFMAGSVAPVLARVSDIPSQVIYGAFFANNLVILSLLIVGYLFYVERRINLATKLTSLLVVILMVAFVGVVLLFYRDEAALAPADADFVANNGLTFRQMDRGVYRAEATPAMWFEGELVNHPSGTQPVELVLPFEFDFFGETYNRLVLRRDGQVVPVVEGEETAITSPARGCIRRLPVIAATCMPHPVTDISTFVSSETVVVVWSDPTLATGGAAKSGIVQLVVNADSTISINFGDFLDHTSSVRELAVGIHGGVGDRLEGESLASLPLVNGEEMALWFDLHRGQLHMVHATLWPAAVFLVAATLAIVFLFRPILSRLVVEPLETILTGLKEVDEGRLDLALDVQTRDEFGDVAKGFNQMIRSLNDSRNLVDEQTELLEAEITYRTVEAARKIDPNLLSKDQVFEQKLREVIEANIGDFDFQVAELADAMAVSTRQLHRKAVNLTAQTPAALIRMLRLEHGHKLLSARAANVSEAAYKCGFKDVSYFTKLFQNKYGITPSELLAQGNGREA